VLFVVSFKNSVEQLLNGEMDIVVDDIAGNNEKVPTDNVWEEGIVILRIGTYAKDKNYSSV